VQPTTETPASIKVSVHDGTKLMILITCDIPSDRVKDKTIESRPRLWLNDCLF